MATSSYFNSHNQGDSGEQGLYEGMIIENIQWSGQDYYYIPRSISGNFDHIFGEDVLSSFESHAIIEMWLENYSGYGGESEMLSKFGMEIRDTATFIVSRKRYTEVVVPLVPDSRPESVKWRPNEGDLIYVPFSQSLFEIKFVEDEYPGFYQIRKKYVWALRCELVQLNNEKFNTGITEIDEVFGTALNRLAITTLTEDGFKFICEDGGNVLLENYDVSRPFDDVIGFGDNDKLKTEFNQVMSWSEDNPFGENF